MLKGRLWYRFKNWLRRHTVILSVLSMLLLFMLVYAAPNIFIFITPGNVGVLWHRFGNGTVVDKVYDEGVNIKFPWDIMYIYNIRLTQASDTFNVLASDGLEIQVDVSTRYRLVKEDVALLHRHIGPDYVKTLLLPEVESNLREEMSQYRPDEIYTSKRAEVEEKVRQHMEDAMRFKYEPLTNRESFLHIENVLIKSIVLPQKVQQAIEDKLTQEQLMLGYDYRLQREEKEKDRKRIEAEGIRIFQDIVKEGISEQFLKWKGINATLELAKSNNSKIVIIGAGEGGLPIILGNLDQPAASALSLPAPGKVSDEASPAENEPSIVPPIDTEPAPNAETIDKAPALPKDRSPDPNLETVPR